MRIQFISKLGTLIAVILLILLSKSYYTSFESNVFLEFESIDEGLEYQVFYTENENEFYDELKSIKFSTEKHSDFVNNKISLGNIKFINSIRIDVGDGDDQIILRNAKLTDGIKERNITNDELLETQNSFFHSIYAENDSLVINTKKTDPSFNIISVNFSPENTLKINYFRLANMFFVLYLIFFAIASWIVNRGFSLKEIMMFICVIAFLFLISIPPLRIDNNEIDVIENRALNRPPTFEDIKNLEITKFENWYNDHFGFRDKYISIKDKIYNQTMITFPFVNSDILNKEKTSISFKGKDNWYWYNQENSVFNYTNIDRYKNDELKEIKSNLESMQTYFKEKGISLYFFVAPDKNQIYPEYYPDYVVRQSDYSKTDQLVDYLLDHDSKIKVIYPKEKMLLAKKECNDLLYWKADTHWNQYGAYVGYLELMGEIAKDYPQISILKESDFEISYQLKSEGDLSKYKSALDETYREYKITNDQLFEYVKNDGIEDIITKNESKDFDIVMFRDSFATLLVPYLSCSFNRCEYIWSADAVGNLAYIETAKPDIVIIQIVERNTKDVSIFDIFNMKGMY